MPEVSEMNARAAEAGIWPVEQPKRSVSPILTTPSSNLLRHSRWVLSASREQVLILSEGGCLKHGSKNHTRYGQWNYRVSTWGVRGPSKSENHAGVKRIEIRGKCAHHYRKLRKVAIWIWDVLFWCSFFARFWY